MEEKELCLDCKLRNNCPLEDIFNEYETKVTTIVEELSGKVKGLEICHTGLMIGEVHGCPRYKREWVEKV